MSDMFTCFATMYTLLPAMKGITTSKLLQAISEMEQEYSKEDLIRHLRRFKTILHRSRTLSEPDKQIVEARMESYDSLLESDPEIQTMLEKNSIANTRRSILLVVEARFPTLLETAQQQIPRLHKIEDLDRLIKQISKAPDETIARWAIENAA